MNSNHSEIAAAWIVAFALIAAMAAHMLLPETPPRLGRGVAGVDAARVGTSLSGGAAVRDADLPLVELDDSGAGPMGTAPSD